MAVPFFKEMQIGAYLVKQKLMGRKRYPLVLMLEPLFRCNLACVGCGKIDYPDAILNRRLSVQECLDAVDECGAPMVAIPGGEPLIHKEIGEIVKGIVARKKFVSLCTNALLLEKKLHLFEPSPYLFFSVHLDGIKKHHDKSVCRKACFDKRRAAIKAAKAQGLHRQRQRTIFDGHPAEDIAAFLDFCKELGVGVSISPGYAYERAPDQEHFLSAQQDQGAVPQGVRARQGQGLEVHALQLFLDFLAGNQESHCTPWGMPTRNVFGWQKPCYLLGEGYVQDLQGADGNHRLGHLRHRRVREVRELHGALRLRADRRRHRGDRNPLKALWIAHARACGPRARWRRKSRSRTSARRNTCSRSRCSRRCPRSMPTRRARRRKRRAARRQGRRAAARAASSDGGGISAACHPHERKMPGLAPGILLRCVMQIAALQRRSQRSATMQRGLRVGRRGSPSAPARPAARTAVRAAQGRGRAGRAPRTSVARAARVSSDRRIRPDEIARIARERAHHRDRIDRAVRPRAGQRRARDGALDRIDHHADGRERHAVPRRRFRHDVRFHVDRERAGLPRAGARLSSACAIGSCDADDRAVDRAGNEPHQTLRPARVGRARAVVVDDLRSRSRRCRA